MSYYDLLLHPPRAQECLARHLRDGSLALFLGAGVSQDSGLPGWYELVSRLRRDVGLSPPAPDAGTRELQLAVDKVRAKCRSDSEYRQKVREHLWSGIDELSPSILRKDLLAALGALLTGSARGTVRCAVTLNYDNILESFLSLYGFSTRIVRQPPELEGSEDVRIYHPHGFLPHPSSESQLSDFVILSSESVSLRAGLPGDEWRDTLRYLLGSHVFLFVGLSKRAFDDPELSPLLAAVAKTRGRSRPIGIWLLKQQPRMSETESEHFMRSGIVPIVLSSKKKVVDFILGICQQAARLNLGSGQEQ